MISKFSSNKNSFYLSVYIFLIYTPLVYALAGILRHFELNFFLSNINTDVEVSLFTKFLLYAILSPIAEEYIFRYIPIKMFKRNNTSYNSYLIAIFSCLAFSFSHSLSEIRFPIIQFILGILLIFLGYKTNIYYSIFFHFLNNLLSLMIPLILLI